MPRSFLLKNYYPRNDIEDIQAAAANLLDLASSAPAPKERTVSDVLECTNLLRWNYEFEKSYWFDTSVLSERNNSDENELSHSEKYGSSSSSSVGSSPKDLIIPHQQNENFSIKNFMHTTIKPAEDEDVAEERQDDNQTKTTEDNEHLNLFSDKTLETTEKNLRQFFENNRINADEISDDIGLDKLDLQNFIDGVSDLPNDEKTELYRWYLSKMQKNQSSHQTPSTDESFACHKCGKIFTYKSYLERHIKYVCPDSTGRTWKCTYCGKAFQYPCYLRRHVRSHTGESPYKCDKCDRAFVRSTDLQRHIRNHTGEKPYQCSQCSRAFARSTDLKRHMRTHTGEKPYKCWQCGKSFSQSGSLQTHIHTHAKDNVIIKGKKKFHG